MRAAVPCYIHNPNSLTNLSRYDEVLRVRTTALGPRMSRIHLLLDRCTSVQLKLNDRIGSRRRQTPSHSHDRSQLCSSGDGNDKKQWRQQQQRRVVQQPGKALIILTKQTTGDLSCGRKGRTFPQQGRISGTLSDQPETSILGWHASIDASKTFHPPCHPRHPGALGVRRSPRPVTKQFGAGWRIHRTSLPYSCRPSCRCWRSPRPIESHGTFAQEEASCALS